MQKYIDLIRTALARDYEGMFREAGGQLRYPFLTPGSKSYADVLWDWDSWLSNVALRQILLEKGDPEASKRAEAYEKGCVLNSLCAARDGWIPIAIGRGPSELFDQPKDIYATNMHKPTLAQHAAFLTKIYGDAEWLRPYFMELQMFVNTYRNHQKHKTGVYFWHDDFAIGVDNDPCAYSRPKDSCGSIFLSCLMYREYLALSYLCDRLGLDEVGAQYREDAEDTRRAALENCWDERDGFFYNIDLNLLPNDHIEGLGRGMPRDWDCLIMRIGVWSGFLALWAGIAQPEMAERVVSEHLRNEKTFCAPYGVRTLSKMEKMYNLRATSNPSSWLGPVWGVSNYLTFRGLVRCGFDKDAKELCEKTIRLFGQDIERFGVLHEYYQPENGMPILNPGFQNWNYLSLNMIAWLEGRPFAEEF